MKMQEHRHGISSCHSIAGMVAESYRRTRTVCPKPIWIFQPGGTRELEPTITLERVPETPPGDQAQVDFAQFQLQFTDEPTITRIVWLFSFVLGFSRLIWARFVLHQDMQTVLRCHMAAFEAIGGVPNEILYDRMKTAVIGEAGGSVVYNRALLDFARHYGFQPKPAVRIGPKPMMGGVAAPLII